MKKEVYKKSGFTLALILVSATALLIYSNSFFSPFHFDDIGNIIKNSKIRSLANFHNFSGTRYIGELSFALNYHFGRLSVFGYHVVNIVIHIINGLLVWLLAGLTLRTPVMERFKMDSRTRWFIALAASLIFIAHPVQTQAVTYIVQRFASLATLFYLLSLVLFVKWRLSSVNRSHMALYILSILSALLAMKTKEISFTLPIVILLYDYTFFKERRKNSYYLIPILLTLLIIPLTIIGASAPVGSAGGGGGGGGGILGEMREAAQETEMISRGDYLLTQFRVIVTYIRLLFLPINQNVDYDYPVYHSLTAPVLLSFIFLLSLIALAVYLFIRSQKTGNGFMRLASFGIFWFFITLSVESSIIPIKDVIFEHRLYLPMAGAACAVSAGLAWAIDYLRGRLRLHSSSMLTIALIVFVLPLSVATYQRNRVWKDGVTLWEDIISKSPKKARGYNSIILLYLDKGRTDDAIRAGRTGVMLAPYIAESHYNLGLAYTRKGWGDQSIEEYKTTLRMKPDFGQAYNNLGVAYIYKGLIDEAIEHFNAALRVSPDFGEAQNNLRLAYKLKELKMKEKK